MNKLKFKYSLSLLNISVVVGIMMLVVYSIFNWNELTAGEGWGVVAIVILGFLILTALIVDLVLQLIFKNKVLMNIVGALILLLYLLYLIPKI